MDYQLFVNGVAMPCCVISVEKKPGGRYGDIRIVAANDAYREVMGSSYYDGMPYYELVPRDNKFEDFCYRAAILKKRMHAYVETRALDCWTDQTLIPLASEEEDKGYCQFIFEFTPLAEANRMSSVSISTSEAVIRASILLSGIEDFKTGISDVLRIILDASRAKSAQILLIDDRRRKIIDFCRVLSDDAAPVRENAVEEMPYSLIRSWEKMLGVSNAIIIKDEGDMQLVWQENPVWAESMRANRVESLVLIPLRRSDEVLGYMYVVNFDVSHTVDVKEMVELMAFLLGAGIYNHILLGKLEELSQIDTLTGINNRRAMKIRVEKLTAGPGKIPFGVLNIDLNGLKVVNDRDGHEAGDRLLIKAGEIIKQIFRRDDLFRTGGDEFIVIVGDIEEDMFYRKVRWLRNEMEQQPDVSFAMGGYWSDGTVDVKTAFRHADARMYEDKKNFYAKHPELKRK